MPDETGRSPLERVANGLWSIIDGPVTWFRDTIVTPNQKQYPWYHQQFRRVPTYDECYTDDVMCMFEANQQFKRDRMVENEIVSILRMRFEDCVLYEAPDHLRKCKSILDEYNRATENWFTKYGDLGGYGDAKAALMKQKHRMVWERRHGPVGTGMKGEQPAAEGH